MRPTVRTALLAAAALGAVCAASSAVAQSYGYDRYAPPPPPPPPEGRYFPRDDRYVQGPLTPNSDGSLGYRPYASQPDTTPDDPGRIAYDAAKDRRVDEGRGYRDSYAYAPPPPYRYTPRGDAEPAYSGRYGDAYTRPYDDGRRTPPPRYGDRYDDADAPPPPRYRAPETGYAPYPSSRGW